jgi:hypothetical protein
MQIVKETIMPTTETKQPPLLVRKGRPKPAYMKQVITCSVERRLVNKLDRIAIREGRSRSAVVEMAVREYTDPQRGRSAAA